MRYKEGEPIPKDQLAMNASDDMLLLSGVLGIFIGLALVFLGRKGKQMYLWVWGAGLAVFGSYLSVSMIFDWTLFEHF